MKKHLFVPILCVLFSVSLVAQKPSKLTSNQIYEKIQKLNFLGTALYVAAHPDDENTRLIAYLANHVKARTGYLSLTRGDGGQNLIGPEIRELLGVIRTQELLAARNVDGGEQFFTRANDFGYSKHPNETLQIWNKKAVLSDVVWVIRNFRPDVIINRFNHRTPGTTHGHHTSSALLSVEAFEKVADKNAFSEQLKYTQTWQPTRLFYNTSSWAYRNNTELEKAHSKKLTKVDVGVYYPLKGLSNNELASVASSQHLCQGFGRLSTRGSQNEYLEFLKGSPLKDIDDIFSGINTTWNRLENGGEIGAILYDVEANFDFVNPSKHLPKLVEAYQLIGQLKDTYWRVVKEKQILEIIEACLGLYIEASVDRFFSVPNATINVNFEVLNRSDIPVKLVSIFSEIDSNEIFKGIALTQNNKLTFKENISLQTSAYSSPYWLVNKGSLGMYKVENQGLIGKPETPKETKVQFRFVINNVPVTFTKNIVRRYAERDQGEIYEPFQILPKVTTKLKDKVLIFADSLPKRVAVEVRAGANYSNGFVSLQVPNGWQVLPKSIPFNIEQKNDKKTVVFTVIPPQKEAEDVLKVVVNSEGKKFTKELVEIHYRHIPKQAVLLSSEAKIVRLNIKKVGNTIGYIKGAGDAIPESLQQIGYRVIEINPSEITTNNLEKLDAVVMGIRAYNVVNELQFKQKFLLEYVKKGGNLIVQYNTSRGVDVGAPYALNLSRDRVTDEYAPVRILEPNHSVLNFPNTITKADFTNWVQERGLYFPNSWGKEFTPILSMNDVGESAKEGSLLVAKYGKGHYIYTGLSFFRELPAGVSGAYKLFTNMLSVGKEKITVKNELKK